MSQNSLFWCIAHKLTESSRRRSAYHIGKLRVVVERSREEEGVIRFDERVYQVDEQFGSVLWPLGGIESGYASIISFSVLPKRVK